MNRWLKSLLCIMLCFVIINCSYALSDYETFNSKILKAFKDYDVVGASFIVYQKGTKIAEYYYGYSDKRNAIKVSHDTKFKIASITKMVCAIGLMKLVEQGYISLDDDIGNILGYKIRNPKFPNVPITVRMLASHTSSIIDSERFSHARGTLDQMVGPKRINDNAFSQYKPGTKYIYSNFGFGIIGSIIEKVSGQTVQEFMKENVFYPINIDAGFSVEEIKDKNVAARYYEGKETESIRSMERQMLSDEADAESNYNVSVGKLLISADDLSKILMALSGNGFVNGASLLSSKSVEQMRTTTNSSDNITANSPYTVGIEKKTDIIDGVELYGHQGLYYSAYCDAFYDPLNQITIVLLTNGMRIVRINGTNALARQLIMLTYKYIADTEDPFLVKE